MFPELAENLSIENLTQEDLATLIRAYNAKSVRLNYAKSVCIAFIGMGTGFYASDTREISKLTAERILLALEYGGTINETESNNE